MWQICLCPCKMWVGVLSASYPGVMGCPFLLGPLEEWWGPANGYEDAFRDKYPFFWVPKPRLNMRVAAALVEVGRVLVKNTRRCWMQGTSRRGYQEMGCPPRWEGQEFKAGHLFVSPDFLYFHGSDDEGVTCG